MIDQTKSQFDAEEVNSVVPGFGMLGKFGIEMLASTEIVNRLTFLPTPAYNSKLASWSRQCSE